ncbi:hypothetical protein [Allomuricauda sp. SCSIO 65647]|uniref:hypothetical protein n=1 Tax=Allomuricauda sp. SCSIO 65647 TaxID=2908843 RepID=UPI001F1BC700|nr:hypothetical protein [Muricauda sp. SCSIO 65647]UJH68770.1 hypothetical protein L0P89_06025 [Muricauda sp. SCSIO 65647]
MKAQSILFSSLFLAAALLLATTGRPTTSIYIEVPTDEDTDLSSEEAFHKMMDVLTHERCVNCHPSDNVPKQGDDSHPHYFGIERGEHNLGYQATNCTTCHQTENNPYSGVPGAPEWSLAPHSMRWEGLDRFEIAESMMDPQRNGGRTPEETLHHLTEHELVLWAWTPGVDAEGNQRELPPVPLEEYREAVKKWFEEGHKIPSK